MDRHTDRHGATRLISNEDESKIKNEDFYEAPSPGNSGSNVGRGGNSERVEFSAAQPGEGSLSPTLSPFDFPFARETGSAVAGAREKIRETRENGLVFIARSPEAAILALHCHRGETEIKGKHTSAASIGFLPRPSRGHYPALGSRWISPRARRAFERII